MKFMIDGHIYAAVERRLLPGAVRAISGSGGQVHEHKYTVAVRKTIFVFLLLNKSRKFKNIVVTASAQHFM